MVMLDFPNPCVVCLSLVQQDKTYSIAVFLAPPTKIQEDDGGESFQLWHLDQ